MTKIWYPVIDYITCEECGTCVAHCESKRHYVYDSEKAPSPMVLRPENCIDHCHGCGDKCSVGAITYIGDNTGWTPPLRKMQEPSEPCCSCSYGETSDK